MKKINLKGISEVLSEKELKNVMGGSNSSCPSYMVTCYCVSTGGTACAWSSSSCSLACGSSYPY